MNTLEYRCRPRDRQAAKTPERTINAHGSTTPSGAWIWQADAQRGQCPAIFESEPRNGFSAMRLSELFKTTGETFTFYPSFCHRFDISVNAAVFLCFIGWKTIPDTDGWREFNSEAITAGTGLSEKEQRTARAALKAAGLLEEDHNRWEHKMFFRLAGIEISEGARELPKGRSTNCQKGARLLVKRYLKRKTKRGVVSPSRRRR